MAFPGAPQQSHVPPPYAARLFDAQAVGANEQQLQKSAPKDSRRCT
ncbi:hypothetical protein ACFVT1_31530 [Streptomyces sp. NPDC057963]